MLRASAAFVPVLDEFFGLVLVQAGDLV